jgi:glc operon protein GlcG
MSLSRQVGVAAVLGLALATRLGFAEGQKAEAPLVTRGRVQLNLAGAEAIMAAAKEKAAAAGLKVNVAVVR